MISFWTWRVWNSSMFDRIADCKSSGCSSSARERLNPPRKNTMGGESDVIHDDLLQNAEVGEPVALHAKHGVENLLAHIKRDLAFCEVRRGTIKKRTCHAVSSHDGKLERKHRIAGNSRDLSAEILEKLCLERCFRTTSYPSQIQTNLYGSVNRRLDNSIPILKWTLQYCLF